MDDDLTTDDNMFDDATISDDKIDDEGEDEEKSAEMLGMSIKDGEEIATEPEEDKEDEDDLLDDSAAM